MAKISSTIQKLSSVINDYDHLGGLVFIPSDSFSWNHQTRTIFYDPDETNAAVYLLHEFGHAVLNHQEYKRDVTLVRMESDAWQQARKIGNSLQISIDDEFIEDALDTYRDWLHDRSLCPSCSHNGMQTAQNEYSCIACGQVWQVNEARTCALRRYPTKKRS